MFKTFKNILSEIKDAHRYIKARGDNYDDVMNTESDGSDFDAGVISTNTRMFEYTFPSIVTELREFSEKQWAKERGVALINIRAEGIPHDFKSALQALEELSTSGVDQNTIWWQGYLFGYDQANIRLLNEIDAQVQSISSKL